MIFTRSDAKIKTPPFVKRPLDDWRSTVLIDLRGQYNNETAQQYQVRLESIIDDNYGKIEAAVRPLWVILCETIDVS